MVRVLSDLNLKKTFSNQAIRDSEEIKVPKLEQFIVKDTNIISRYFELNLRICLRLENM
jgi:hypothetical protein